ncbi:MAG TPA: hypothetical protein DEB70_11560 [Planctomycetaceae bacterium]|nr:hypothetical protein [Planctomycetaceae bacterium]
MKKFILLDKKNIYPIIVGGILCFLSTGCGSSQLGSVAEVSEVNGTVLLPTGRPLKGGKLVLRPNGGAIRGARPMSVDINKDGTFLIQSTSKESKIVAAEYKVFINVSSDPRLRGLRSQVPQKYQDIGEDETDLFVNLAEQADGIVLKMTKG